MQILFLIIFLFLGVQNITIFLSSNLSDFSFVLITYVLPTLLCINYYNKRVKTFNKFYNILLLCISFIFIFIMGLNIINMLNTLFFNPNLILINIFVPILILFLVILINKYLTLNKIFTIIKWFTLIVALATIYLLSALYLNDYNQLILPQYNLMRVLFLLSELWVVIYYQYYCKKMNIKDSKYYKWLSLFFVGTIIILFVLNAIKYQNNFTYYQINNLMQVDFIDFFRNYFTNFETLLFFLIVLINRFLILILLIKFNTNPTKQSSQKIKNKLNNVIYLSIITIIILNSLEYFGISLNLIVNDIIYISSYVLVFFTAILCLFVFYYSIITYHSLLRRIIYFTASTLPIYFLLNKSYIFDFNFLRIFFLSLNYSVIGISIFVFIYYTIETIILLFNYKKKYLVEDLEIDEKEKIDYKICILIPCLNEEKVIKGTLLSLIDNDYDNFQIYVVNDASDDKTEEKVQEVAKQSDKIKLINRMKPNAQQGKGEALNYTLEIIKKDLIQDNVNMDKVIIGVIDADSEVDIDYFTKVNKVFNSNSNINGLQSKVRIYDLNEDKAQDLEFAEITHTTQKYRQKIGTVAFGGNGQFSKISLFDQIKDKPWSDSLVEDFDLSLRLYLESEIPVIIKQFDDLYITQSGIVNDNESLVNQRTRWAQGNISSIKYLPKVITSKKLRINQKLEISLTLLKPWLMAIEYLVVVYILLNVLNNTIIFGIVKSFWFVMINLLWMTAYIFIINLIWGFLYNRQKKEKLKILKWIRDALYLSNFLVVLTQIYVQAIYRYLFKRKNWVKTDRNERENR